MLRLVKRTRPYEVNSFDVYDGDDFFAEVHCMTKKVYVVTNHHEWLRASMPEALTLLEEIAERR